eukprot:910756-Amphidinium_carterae.1
MEPILNQIHWKTSAENVVVVRIPSRMPHSTAAALSLIVSRWRQDRRMTPEYDYAHAPPQAAPGAGPPSSGATLAPAGARRQCHCDVDMHSAATL